MHGLSMTPPLAYAEIELDETISVEFILKTPKKGEFGCTVEVFLNYRHKKSSKLFIFLCRIKKVDVSRFTHYMKKNRPRSYTPV